MKTQKFAFGTNSRRTLPFDIGGVTFFAHPLTVAEELQLADVGDRYDLDALEGTEVAPFIQEQIGVLSGLLRSRVQGDVLINPGWVEVHMGTLTLTPLLALLRSGEKPQGSLTLTSWLDEPFTVQERTFDALPLSFAEQLQAGALGQDGTSREITEGSLRLLAALLTARATDNGGKVTPEWLMANLGTADLGPLLSLIQNGPEVPDPNADETAPEGGPASGAAGLPGS
ncbi:hypothetical protein GO986_16215 [Deinococcus sp. HMF7620]|uniref:Uncharacterized protein n=1 Tax=Deinococcus arboris TaxID=2682977 RepID=A0A7C9I4M4_9DEIO|nr:hypothetical protein [Deinococcus arboris]MVN88291.1 hypothetical protein [Deinococcus arboris]